MAGLPRVDIVPMIYIRAGRKSNQQLILQIAAGREFCITRTQIEYFLLQFRTLDFSEPESQRRIVDIFVNSVFVYDDKITITFNYSGDNRTITLYEVEAAVASVREPSDMGHQQESVAGSAALSCF